MSDQSESKRLPENLAGKTRGWRRVVGRVVVVVAALCLAILLAAALVLWYYWNTIPRIDSISDYRPPQVTRLFDRKGRAVAELFRERRTFVGIERIAPAVRHAFLAAEDADFYSHPGLDFLGMLRALLHNLLAGRIVQGGSTITQQLVKILLLTPERTLKRKIKEMLLALRLESRLSKDEILTVYLNQINLGHGNYGVEEASRYYFGKSASELDLAQAATLAALAKSPVMYSPVRHPEKSKLRRDWILDQMAEKGFVEPRQAELAKQKPIEVVRNRLDPYGLSPYYAEHCRRLLMKWFGTDMVLEGGLKVRLALDLELQRAAREAVASHLREIEKRRYGFKGALGHVEPSALDGLRKRRPRRGTAILWDFRYATEGRPEWRELRDGLRVVVPFTGFDGRGRKTALRFDLGFDSCSTRIVDAAWTGRGSTERALQVLNERLRPGDLLEVEVAKKEEALTCMLSQPPRLQAAVVVLDPATGHVLAMVGGVDFRKSSFIRAVQAKRQPGSAFKPIVYAAAIRSRNYSPSTIVVDSPEVFRAALHGTEWRPRNFERIFHGPVSLRYALAHSINTVAVKLAADLGLESVVEMAHELGITTPLKSNLSLALGSAEVIPLELAQAYSVFASGGWWRPAVFILDVEDADGRHLQLPRKPEPRRALSSAEAYIMVSLLRSVVEMGTGRAALKLGRPLAGKTGTTNAQRDGWFVGFSPDLVAGVWVGRDDHRSMGGSWAQGAGTALPIWISVMGKALESRPVLDFRAPAGVVHVRVDPRNGLLARPGLVGAVWEVFLEGNEPEEYSPDTSPVESVPETGAAVEGSVQKLPKGFFR